MGSPDKELISKQFPSIATLFPVLKRNNFNLLVSLKFLTNIALKIKSFKFCYI